MKYKTCCDTYVASAIFFIVETDLQSVSRYEVCMKFSGVGDIKHMLKTTAQNFCCFIFVTHEYFGHYYVQE